MSPKRACRQVRELIGPYADNELDQDARSRVEEHLKTCPDCRRELEAIQMLHRLVREKATPRPYEGWLEEHRFRVLHRLRLNERLEREVRGAAQIPWLKLATVAGGLVVVLIVVFAGWRVMTEVRVGRSKSIAGIDTSNQVLAEKTEPVKPEAAAKGTRGEVALVRPSADKRPGVVIPAEELLQSQAEGDRSFAGEAEAGSHTRETGGRTTMSGRTESYFLEYEQEPVLLSLPKPTVPVPSETGLVVLRLLIEPDSSVSLVNVERSSGSSLLDSLAVEMAKGARFQPALEKEEPVRVWIELPIRFPLGK
ncbi:MAG: TonB family protein [candidate division WOR-3 bacterium]